MGKFSPEKHGKDFAVHIPNEGIRSRARATESALSAISPLSVSATSEKTFLEEESLSKLSIFRAARSATSLILLSRTGAEEDSLTGSLQT